MALSFSQLQSYRTCPRQYEYANVKKIPKVVTPGESFGSSVHNALRKWALKYELHPATGRGDPPKLFEDSKADFPDAPTVENLVELWHQSFIVEGHASRAEADAARIQGEALMRKFYDWWALERREVLAVEKGFRWCHDAQEAQSRKDAKDSKEVTITGRFDRVEKANGGIRVIDFKTTAPRTQAEVDADLQLSIYALAAREVFGEPCRELVLLFLDEEQVTVRSTSRTAGALRDVAKQIAMIAERIAGRDFHPTPSKGVCSHCPYRNICDASAV